MRPYEFLIDIILHSYLNLVGQKHELGATPTETHLMVLKTKQTLCREVLVSSDGIKRLELYNIGSCNTSLKVR